jgi:hypothetical protein
MSAAELVLYQWRWSKVSFIIRDRLGVIAVFFQCKADALLKFARWTYRWRKNQPHTSHEKLQLSAWRL